MLLLSLVSPNRCAGNQSFFSSIVPFCYTSWIRPGGHTFFVSDWFDPWCPSNHVSRNTRLGPVLRGNHHFYFVGFSCIVLFFPGFHSYRTAVWSSPLLSAGRLFPSSGQHGYSPQISPSQGCQAQSMCPWLVLINIQWYNNF